MGAGLSCVLALAAVLLAGPRSEAAIATVRSPAALRVDQRGFPRTLVFGCGYENEIARRDIVIGQAFCDIDKLRRLNPGGVFLLEPGLFPSGYYQGKVQYGGMNVTYGEGLYYWRDVYAWKDGGCDTLPGGVNLGCIRQFDPEYDWLHNVNGSVALIDGGTAGHPGWNLADPLGRGTPDLVAKLTAYAAKLDGIYSRGWTGIFSDNWIYGAIGPDAYGTNLDTNRDGKVDDLATLRRQWDNGLNQVGRELQSFLPGKLVVGNGNWFGALHYYGDQPGGWLTSANGTMVEGIERFYDSSTQLVKLAGRWLGTTSPQPRYLLFLQDALDAQGRRVTAPSGANPNDPEYMLDPAVMKSMRWGLTLAMMSGAYYEILLNSDQGTRWWYDEYDGGQGVRRRAYLGLPLAAAKQIRPGVWQRDFQRGTAINNSTTKPAVVKLTRKLRHLRGTQDPALNDGKVVSRVTVPGHDGVILLTVGKGP